MNAEDPSTKLGEPLPSDLSPSGGTRSRHLTALDKLRLILAIVVTVTVLPYAWAYNLVAYVAWRHRDRPLLAALVVGLIAVIALNFNLASKFASRRTALKILGTVLLLWAAFGIALMVLRNGSALPHAVVFAGFFPATLWVAWLAWMFFLPMRWSVRLGVLVLLLLAVIPFATMFEARDLTGDVRVNFDFRWHKPPVVITSTVGELTHPAARLATDSKNDFPAFQGPARTAVLPDVKLEPDWTAHPPKELWRVPVGAGWGGFTAAGGYAFTQEQRGDDECVVARDLLTGREIWVHKDKAPYGDKPRYEGMGGPGPRCTPTIDEGRIYTVGATGIMNCLDGATGHAIWSKNIVQDNGGHVAGHGVCGSPLIVKNTVVVAPTGKNEHSLAAYDRETGKRIWAAGRDSAGYATPLLATVSGTSQILNYTENGITSHDPATGAILWYFGWTNDQDVVCSEPLANAGAPDRVLLTNGYGKGSVLLKVGKSSGGAWSAAPIWTNRNMKTKFTTAVIYGDCVYGLDDGIFQCIDLETGAQKWKRGRYQHGQILLAGNLLLVQTELGPVVLVEPNPNQLIEHGKIPALSSKTWNCPALAGRYLLVRNDTEGVCYEVSLRPRS